MLSNKIKIFVVISILATLVLYHVCIGTAKAEDKTNSKVDYVAKINELAKAGRDESLNAAPYYEKAIELYIDQPEQLWGLGHRIWPADIVSDQKKLLKEWGKSNSDALTQLELGAKQQYCWIKRSSPGGTVMGMALPELSTFRKLAFAVTWR
ncbi:MAG: hypothetical protein ACYS8Y_05770, partial [Planctomycetota bacterium]